MNIPYSRLFGPLLFATVCGAQTAPETGSAKADEVVQLEAFEITGEKLGRTAQETQISVAALRGVELEQSTDTELSDIFARTANTYANASGFTIRGIPNTGFTFSEGSDMATVLVDGATVDGQMLGFDGVSIWDIDQIEILRGPQSTTQGRNSMAGAVIARTKNPTFHWDGALRATYGEYDTRQLAFAVGGPLVPEALAFRFSLEDKYSDGALTNITRDEDDWHRTDSTNLRGKLLFQPATWQGFSALLTYAQTESQNGDRAYAYGSTIPELYERLAYENTRNHFDTRSRTAALEINQEFSNGWLLTATTGWSDFLLDSLYDGDRNATEELLYGYGYDNDSLTQEIRLLAKGDTWRALAGVYFADSSRMFYSSGPFYYVIPSPLDQVFGLPTPSFALLDLQQNGLIETTNAALFVNGDWQPTDRWTFNLGARFDREKLDRTSGQNVVLAQGFPGAVALMDVPSFGIVAGMPADAVISAIAADASAGGNGEDTFKTFLPSAGITYHWTDTLSTGATVTRGYRSGGVSFNQKRAVIVPFDPEYTTNYELSFRSVWLDGKVVANANAFYVDWVDQQVSVQLSSDIYDTQVANAGQSSYYGAELELREDLGGGWSAYQSIGHTRTRFDDFSSAAFDYSGNAFPNSPRWTASAGVSYSRRAGWFGHASVSYVSAAFTRPENDPDYLLPAHTVVNAKLGYRFGDWSVFAYANNLLDEDYLESLWEQSATRFGAEPALPRVLGVGLDTTF
ncbi:TonB-dependent receptor [Synoicihabitans lomoniglobus]|uniref:TonB-dependent receptor n=1 Tax=Synoicihabitans lomoniglobus TaxID=2909285 RepID=A0AAF0A1Y8_9BACT|nr:TonB-dependent receptor [Opitutaceae bacterium LMO-M01]WED65497.1 TonB-dependent receptor [Opitutaceae bacterium LMO-M01]